MTTLQRLFLAIVIPLGAMLVAFLSGFLLFVAGLPEHVLDWGFPLAIILSIVLVARSAPRLVPTARVYSLWRRALAGMAGLGMGFALTRTAEALGLKVDALSHDPSPVAMVHEGTALVLFYGGTVCASFVTLGRAKLARNQRREAAEQLDAADEARASSAGWRGPRS